MNLNSIVIYHGSCSDGSAAALAAYEKLGARAEYIPGKYGMAMPDDDYITGKDIYMVDFSTTLAEVERMSNKANSFIMLDHHKTAQDALGGHPNCIFHMDHSGATLSWAYFNREKYNGLLRPELAPEFFKYIEDRDLWKLVMPDSLEISSALSSYGGRRTFSAWLPIIGDWDTWKPILIQEGRAIRRFEDDLKRNIVSKSELVSFEQAFGGSTQAAVVNTPVLFSDVAEEIAYMYEKIGAQFGCAYFWDSRDSCWVFSLRSRNTGYDVSKLAKSYGGGGHVKAASFKLNRLPWKSLGRTFTDVRN